MQAEEQEQEQNKRKKANKMLSTTYRACVRACAPSETDDDTKQKCINF